MDKAVLISETNGIATLTINRPKALNALNESVFDELDIFFTSGYKEYDGLKGVVITGAGEKAFAAGADIKKFLELDKEMGERLSRRGQDVFFNIEEFHLPVIAAVNGFALGGGCELAMACHIRIAGSKARFGQPEVNLGLIPGYGGSQRLIQLIGKGKAIELLLTGDMIGAEEAHRLGLANHVVEPGQEVEKAIEIVEKISTKGPTAISKTIECVNQFFKDKDAFYFESREFGILMNSKEGKEGALAFIEKRKPNFNV